MRLQLSRSNPFATRRKSGHPFADARSGGNVGQGLTDWYRNDAGRVFALLPYRLVDYWKKTKTFKAEDFNLI